MHTRACVYIFLYSLCIYISIYINKLGGGGLSNVSNLHMRNLSFPHTTSQCASAILLATRQRAVIYNVQRASALSFRASAMLLTTRQRVVTNTPLRLCKLPYPDTIDVWYKTLAVFHLSYSYKLFVLCYYFAFSAPAVFFFLIYRHGLHHSNKKKTNLKQTSTSLLERICFI